jgi:hypothetical protein|tara:strand:+ start:40848 stop:41156 length:309 start_codon:yes stop_codon:yes gene_type:complete
MYEVIGVSGNIEAKGLESRVRDVSTSLDVGQNLIAYPSDNSKKDIECVENVISYAQNEGVNLSIRPYDKKMLDFLSTRLKHEKGWKEIIVDNNKIFEYKTNT